MSSCVHVRADNLRGQKIRSLGPPGAGIAGFRKAPDVSAGNLIQV